MRAYGNNWQDSIMGEIELGSTEAYIAMAWDERFSDEFNRSYDHGISMVNIWHTFKIDELAEDGLPPSNDTPWGPMYDPDEFVAEWDEDGSWCPPGEECSDG